MVFVVPYGSSYALCLVPVATAMAEASMGCLCINLTLCMCLCVRKADMLYSHAVQSRCTVRDDVDDLACCAAWCLAAALLIVKIALTKRMGAIILLSVVDCVTILFDLHKPSSCLLSDELTLAILLVYRCQEQQR